MSETVPPLSKERLRLTTWHTQDDGSVAGSYYRDNSGDLLSEQDLAALHPSLPTAVRAQLQGLNNQDAPDVLLGRAVANQLHYLSQSPLLLPDSYPDQRYYALEFEDLQRMSTSGVWLLTALSYRVTTVDDIDIVVPVREGLRNFELSSSWLDTHFPGWLPRFEAAEFLGLSDKELTAHVFARETPSAVETTLPRLTID